MYIFLKSWAPEILTIPVPCSAHPPSSLITLSSLATFLFGSIEDQFGFLSTLMLTAVAYLYYVGTFVPVVKYNTLMDWYIYINIFYVVAGKGREVELEPRAVRAFTNNSMDIYIRHGTSSAKRDIQPYNVRAGYMHAHTQHLPRPFS